MTLLPIYLAVAAASERARERERDLGVGMFRMSLLRLVWGVWSVSVVPLGDCGLRGIRLEEGDGECLVGVGAWTAPHPDGPRS